MRLNEAARTTVEASWNRIQPRLRALADELSAGEEDWHSRDSYEVASVGAEVKDLLSSLSDELSAWLPELPEHDELDAFLYELSSRQDGEVFQRAATETANMLEFLRQISYGTLPEHAAAPDVEDVTAALSGLLTELGATI